VTPPVHGCGHACETVGAAMRRGSRTGRGTRGGTLSLPTSRMVQVCVSSLIIMTFQ